MFDLTVSHHLLLPLISNVKVVLLRLCCVFLALLGFHSLSDLLLLNLIIICLSRMLSVAVVNVLHLDVKYLQGENSNSLVSQGFPVMRK